MKSLPLLVFAFFALASVGAAQQGLIEEKAKSGERFGEQALKVTSKAGTVGGNYRYGKKLPPRDLKESERQAVLKQHTAPPAPAKDSKKGADDKPLTPGQVALGVGAVVAAPILLLMLLGGGTQIHKEIAREQMLGKP